MASLWFGIFAGAVGVAYMVYGRQQAKFVPAIAGLLLCVYPYFIDSVLWLSVAGAVLVIAPFLIDY